MTASRLYLTLLCILFGFSSAQQDPALYAAEDSALPFSDISLSPFRDAIVHLASDEYIGGFPDGTFRPATEITRAEFIALTMRSAARVHDESLPGLNGNCLADDDAWYVSVICAAVQQGIINGETADLRPDAALTYAEALKILLTGFELADDFSVQAGAAWHEPYRQFADRHGLLPAGSYAPDGTVTRELAANLLYRVLILEQDPANLGAYDENAALAAAITAAVITGRASFASTAARASSGCQAISPRAPVSVSVAGRERSIITHVPQAYEGNEPFALLLAFHGRTNSNTQVRNYMDLERFAADTIVVYPGGIPGTGGYSWSDAGDTASSLRDYQLFDAIIETFRRDYCIDENRIFVVGHSLGAWFANSLACARADVIRAAATLAGGIAASSCPAEVAVMLLHNPRDQLVAISEGEQALSVFLENNRLAGSSALPGATRFNCVTYGLEQSHNPVAWCPHEIDYPFGSYYDPHSWPSGTGQAIIEFFSSF